MRSRNPLIKKQKTLLITGASSFIGKNLCEQLEGYKIYSPSSKELNLLDTDSVNLFFKIHKIDVVINAALYIGPSKKQFAPDMLGKNLKIFFNLINNKKFYKKMILFGSGAEYNKSAPIVDIKESAFGKSLPEDDYGIFKYTVSKFIEQTDNIINLRLFGVYGKHEDYTKRFISNAICMSLFDVPITLKQNVFFDYLYIDDLVKIVDFFIKGKARYKFYNVGQGEKIDFLSIAKIIKKVTNSGYNIKILKSGLANEYTCNNKRLLKEIGNFKFMPMEESIRILKNWYLDKKSSIKKSDIIPG